MPDIFDTLMQPAGQDQAALESPGMPPASLPNPPPFHNPGSPGDGSIFDQLMGGPAAPQSAPAAAPSGGAPSWWDEHGHTVEAATAAGIGLLLGPRAVRGMGKLAEKTGVLGETAARGTKAVQSILAPATVDEPAGQASALIREYSGTAARDIATTQKRLEPQWREIGSADDADKLQFINYVEGRSKGVSLQNPALQPLADEVKTAYDSVHKDLQHLSPMEKVGFVEDYYRHQWKRDDFSNAAFSKQGMSGFTKERTIPTIQAGIDRGLTPKSLDPVQTTLEYVENARRFIASRQVVDRARQTGHIINKAIGSKKPFPNTFDKWVPLEGSLANKGFNRLYAPEGFARVYNNWVSPGFSGAAGDVVNGARRVSNSVTGLELGLSGFHMTTMVNEAIINDVAKSIQEIAGGRIGDALGSLIKAPLAPVRLWKQGKQLENVYLGMDRGNQTMRQITDLLTKAGGRGAGITHAKDYEFTAAGSFFDSWKRGSAKVETIAALQDMKNRPVFGTMAAVGKVVGKTLQTFAEPLFKWYIPRLKNGAFYDNMASWLKANPSASKDMQLRAARDIWDSIDNRFGEMVQDNIFWKQHMKQSAMLAMRSYSWTMGSIREIGGGAKDMAMHKFTPRAAYTIALPVVYGTVSGIYQYLKTGKPPQDMHDLLAPQTGGTDPATGLPERMIMPGYMKDVIGWTDHPTDELINKLSTGIKIPIDLMRNKDWRGAPIRPPQEPGAPWEKTAPGWLKAYLDYVAGSFVPISVRDLGKGSKRGSNITTIEKAAGLRAGGRHYVDPEGSEQLKHYYETKDWRKKLQYDERQKSLIQGYGGVE